GGPGVPGPAPRLPRGRARPDRPRVAAPAAAALCRPGDRRGRARGTGGARLGAGRCPGGG
ncbi:MAG: hypothetical protein AVDCRST_MAG19-2287, partial [uncultured Thermomicrobiales bacterium]